MSKLLLAMLATLALPSTAAAAVGPGISFSTGNSIYLAIPTGPAPRSFTKARAG